MLAALVQLCLPIPFATESGTYRRPRAPRRTFRQLAAEVVQLALDFLAPPPPPKRRAAILGTPGAPKPLSPEERRYQDRLYRKNIGLIKTFGSKLTRRFKHLDNETVFHRIDWAFVKAARIWDESQGKFSTILWSFALNECRHATRDEGWTIKAPGAIRLRGSNVRKLLGRGYTPMQTCAAMGITMDQLKDALLATQGVDHDIMGFDLHADQGDTPWDYVEAEEAREWAMT